MTAAAADPVGLSSSSVQLCIAYAETTPQVCQYILYTHSVQSHCLGSCQKIRPCFSPWSLEPHNAIPVTVRSDHMTFEQHTHTHNMSLHTIAGCAASRIATVRDRTERGERMEQQLCDRRESQLRVQSRVM